MDIVIALSPSLFFGAMALLIGYFGGGARQQNFGVTVSAGLTSIIAFYLIGGSWSVRALGAGLAAGFLWTGAQFFQLRAFKAHGVSRTMPLSTGIQLFINALAGVVLFGEWNTLFALAVGVSSLLAITLGTMLSTWSEENLSGLSPARRRSGILNTIAAGTLFGLYPPIIRFFDVAAADGPGGMGVGLLIGGLVLGLSLPPSHPHDRILSWGTLKIASAGLMWTCANTLLLEGNERIGVATGFALSQLGVVISTFGGIALLGEQRTRKEMRATVQGVTLVLVGGALLAVAKAHGN
ncbi:MAG: GRP family sugar transporter [Flaviflexus sp.]|nr:GRP family sugar transporter [Flaviflexus sp.]